MKHLYRITRAAEKYGLPRSTIHYAIRRGEIDVSDTTTGCGLQLIDERRLRAWIKQYYSHERRGRPAKGE